MTRTVTPIAGTLDADVRLPGSKSITNRALVAAALATGSSTLVGIGRSDDTDAMIMVLRALGVDIAVEGTVATVAGSGGELDAGAGLDARQSGTTARFAAPLLVAAGGGRLDGHPQMRARPMADLVAAMRQLGASVDSDRLPMKVSIDGAVGARAEIPADVSSQFISALLLAGPALPDGLDLTLTGRPVSTPYIEMTLAVMAAFGVTVERSGDRYVVPPGGYTAVRYQVEPDASTATYPLAAAAMVGGRVRVEGLGRHSVQGDFGFADVIEAMGAAVHVDDQYVEVRGSGALRALTVDLGDMSDTAPTFGALAARAVGESHATGIGFIRTTKESDRVGATVTELERLGIEAAEEPDGFAVTGGSHHHAIVHTYDDHRMAMALSLLGLVEEPVTIDEPDCVAKTFPAFYDMIEDLRSSARTEPLVLAIDGPAGSGKSTVAAMVAERLRLPHLDTGAMYRAVSLLVHRRSIDLDDADAVMAAAKAADLVVERTGVWLDGEDVTNAIREPEVTAIVSPVAAIGSVRNLLVGEQRMWAGRRGAAVVEGRDIGSAVFPDATLKVFLTASVEERARRRAAEVGATDLEDMRRRIVERDEIDSTRQHDPLTVADGAHVIDSTTMSLAEVTDAIVALWEGVTA